MSALEASDETRLVARLRAGDEQAYEDLVRTHTGKMFAVARRLLGESADAEDAVQDALLAAWKNIRGFEGRAALSTWLHRITVNTCIAKLRSRKGHVPMDDISAGRGIDRDAPSDWPDESTDPVEQADMARLVWDTVDELSDDFRTVVVLRDVEQMPSKEVASALGISDSLVRQRLHRGRQIVAERLRPELCSGREMTCGGRLDLLFDFIDHDLAEGVRVPVTEHVASCGDCQDLLPKFQETIAQPLHTARALPSEDSVRRVIESVLASFERLRTSDSI